jgi:hypothetical protein
MYFQLKPIIEESDIYSISSLLLVMVIQNTGARVAHQSTFQLQVRVLAM